MNTTKGKDISINTGAVVVVNDATFTNTYFINGTTNVSVAQFTFTSYGEDVKVNRLTVSFASSSISSLNNVALYINGGQIGNVQNYRGTALTYTFGSNFIIPMGQTVTLQIRVDTTDASSSPLSSGFIAAIIGGEVFNGQGLSSSQVVSVPASPVYGNTMSIYNNVSLTNSVSNLDVIPGSYGVKIGSFTVQTGPAEGIIVGSFDVGITGDSLPAFTLTNLTNLKIKENTNIVGVYNFAQLQAINHIMSTANIVISPYMTKTFDIYADVRSGFSGVATTSMRVYYRGLVSNQTGNTALVIGATVTAVAEGVATLAAATLVSSSPVSQFVVGSTNQTIATFKLSTSANNATVRELRFMVTGTDAIESITVNGTPASVISGGTTTVSGLSIPVTTTGTDVAVMVKYSGFKNATTNGSLQAGVASTSVTLSYIEATQGSGSIITSALNAVVSSNVMSLVASKPTVTMGAGNVDTLVLGSENKVGEFTVSADANGKISVSTTTLDLSATGVTSPVFSLGRIADGNTTIPSTTAIGSGPIVVTFTTPYEITAGSSKTFSLFANVAGSPQASITPYVTSRLTSAATFNWIDVIGGNGANTGSVIYNFPTSSFSTKR